MQQVDQEPPPSPEAAEKLYVRWNSRIDDALAREKDYRAAGRRYVDIYEARKSDETPFAILYSNTETLLPAVYNSRPIPIVKRRFKDADPLGKSASEVSTRTLKFLIDNETADYDNFDDLMIGAALEGILVNRGLTRFKYDGDLQSECVHGEAVRWDKFFHGYARTWKKVPWIGFEWDMSEEELRKNFSSIPFELSRSTSSEDDPVSGETRQERTGVKTFKVYEIWNKSDRKVYFFSPAYAKGPLKIVDDPLGISTFFPCPRPMNFMRKVTTLVPTPLYDQYRQQAQELNDITRRLKALIKAVKVRGAYNSTVEGIEKMLEAGDNELIPVENMSSMPDNTGIDKILFIIPISDLVTSIQTLYTQREQVKQVIYEITGISDILRGSSVASETATAQNIKNQWGTLRLKRAQKEVQRYCREALAIMLEIAAAKFDIRTFQQMTGLPYLTEGQKAQIGQQLQMAQQQAQMSGQQPPAPPPEAQTLLAQPTWEQIIGLFHDELALAYKVDIETNSTIDAEAAQDKQDIAELLNGISQFLNGVAPLVQQGVLPMEVAKAMLMTISRRYNFGDQLEEALDKMQSPPQKGPDPAEQAKAAAAEAQAKAQMQKAQIEMESLKARVESERQLAEIEMKLKVQELNIKQQELLLQERALGMKLKVQEAQHTQRMQQIFAKSAAEEQGEPEHAAV